MSFLFDTPDPPDPRQTSAASTATNIGTAIANANLQNVNQVTPQGNLTWSQSGQYDYTDPASGQVHAIPQFTATQTLSPAQGAIQNEQEQAKLWLSRLAASRGMSMYGDLTGSIDVSGAPAYGNPENLSGAPQAATSFGAAGDPATQFAGAGNIANTFGDVGNVQGQVGYDDNFSADRQRVEDALMGRLNPSLEIERNKYEQQLADQGIRYGSPAYENAMRNYSMQANDARFGAIQQAGQEQQRLFGMALGRGEFANKAQQQQFEQAKARGEFGNEAQQQAYQQALGRGQFYNAGQQQQFGQQAARGTFSNAALAQNFQQAATAFNAQNAQRNQYLGEQYALRNQPINEISALLSGSQVQMPNFLNTKEPTIPTTDVAGIINRNFDQQMSAFNTSSQNANQLIGGLFGGAAGIISDREVKHDVERMGSVMTTEDKALPIYSFKYDRDIDPSQQTRVGPMAQDVEKIDKRAVRKVGGVRHIKGERLGELLKVA